MISDTCLMVHPAIFSVVYGLATSFHHIDQIELMSRDVPNGVADITANVNELYYGIYHSIYRYD